LPWSTSIFQAGGRKATEFDADLEQRLAIDSASIAQLCVRQSLRDDDLAVLDHRNGDARRQGFQRWTSASGCTATPRLATGGFWRCRRLRDSQTSAIERNFANVQ
jgi:hypothetical protein